MNVYTLTTLEFEEAINDAKNTFLWHLYSEGILTAEQTNHLTMNVAIILRKPSFFSNLWRNYIKNADNPYYVVIEQKNLEIPELDGENEKSKNNVLKLVPKDGGDKDQNEKPN